MYSQKIDQPAAKSTIADTNISPSDIAPLHQFINRSWNFRTVGYGHSEEVWRAMVSNLRLVGYDGALSIEHEDGLMTQNEGFEKAAQFLKNIIIKEKAGKAWWT